tara:strand:+ start:95 stop:286 length:192 start_codon:yes stop_codon:yes gene_type:complete
MRHGNYYRIHNDENCPSYIIEQQIRYHEKQRDFYCGNTRGKKSQQREINILKKILKRNTSERK